MKTYKLGDLLNDIIDYRGQTPKKLDDSWKNEGIRAISAMNIKNGMLVKKDNINYGSKELYNKWMKQEIEKNDILLTSEAPLGEVMLWNSDEKIILSQRVYGLKPNRKLVYPKFLYALMQTELFYKKLVQKQSGTTVFGIRQPELLRIKLKIPEMKKQKEIGDEYYKAELLHKNNNKIKEKIGQYLELLYHKWFIDKNFIEENKSNDLNKSFTKKRLRNIVEIQNNTITPKEEPNREFVYFSIPEYDKTGSHLLEKGKNIGSNKYIVDSNNILVSKLNPRFNRIIYPQNIDLGICSTEFVVWKPKYDNILEYLFVLAKTRKFVKYTSQLASGTSNSHKRIKPDLMLNYSLNFNLEIIKEFNELVKPFITKLNNLTRQNKILKETREITINSIL